MNKKFTLIFLCIIVIIASLLRLYQLGSVPISPDWDEVALGYNAYSILHTGKDEYGKFLPIVLRSYDDYKPALYAYVSIPAIALFGLNVFAVRLPSAIFGVLAVIGVYFLTYELLKKKEVSLLSSFLLAISPWHIQFSHAAFEANVGLAFNIFGAFFFLKGLKKPWMLFLSVFFIILSMYIYQSDRVFAPLLFLAIMLIYRKDLLKLPRNNIFLPAIFGCILLLPLLFYTLTSKDALARAKGVSIFSDSTQFLKTDAQRILDDKKNKDFSGLLFDNRRLAFSKEIIANYLSHFDLNWLFISGDISRHHAPGMGLIYLWELPFLLMGMYFLIFGLFDKKSKMLLWSWFLLAPVPASVTTGVPHAIRSLNFLPTFQIFIAIGIFALVLYISKIKYFIYLIFPVYFLFFIFNILYYLNQYFVQQNYFNAVDWQYGYAKIVPEVKKIHNKYSKIIVSNQPFMDQSYMFFLFYLRYPPVLYQKQSQNVSGGFRENHSFDIFEFRPIHWDQEQKNSDILYIGRKADFPENVQKLNQVSFPDGQPAIVMVEG